MRRPALYGLAAVLLPSALAVHEAVYLVNGEAAATASQHGYLAHAVPLIAAAAGSLAAAALLLPALGLGGGEACGRSRLRPFTIALALVALFGVQESVEAFALGGGAAQLAAAFAAAWLLLPLTIALGALGATVIEWLERAGEGLARLLGTLRRRPAAGARPRRAARPGTASLPRLSPLQFGLASRPPPQAA